MLSIPVTQYIGGFGGRKAEQPDAAGRKPRRWLHDGVLDAVVDCLDQVTGAVRADERA